MEDDFDKWNKQKKYIQGRKTHIFCREREIWWCSLGMNIGSEENGKGTLFARPVLVVQKFNNQTSFVVPLTSKNKISPYHFLLEQKSNSILLTQPRLISNKRLHRCIRRITTYEFALIKNSLVRILFP
ncbi:MAG: type II toxin-antitoxin system PemK/MazF family toxin [Patescibacteria group bacterium]